MKSGVLSVLLFCVLLCSCSRDVDNPTPVADFSLSRRHVDIQPGDTAEIFVSGDLEFAVKSMNEDIATVYRDGRKAIIDAVGEGETDVVFLSQFYDITCTVNVGYSLSADSGDRLADATSRVEGDGLFLAYGNPGIMIIERGNQVEFVDVATAERVVLTFDAEAGRGINHIVINGVEQQVSECRLCKESGTTRWYVVLTNGGEDGFWVVVDTAL